ncbi:M24 family metallopeptidase [Sphingomonas sp.]|uniref:M24 family metallopeptidase n=1 Tax=Sphingomonas sp. TaxID=28214 RepID=UPI002C1E3FFC|nr:M24 family metallopeptidase [Sphingomonas sp.]HWK35264.1 M24 family metallopeptidase [Sphingomonas sp.]
MKRWVALAMAVAAAICAPAGAEEKIDPAMPAILSLAERAKVEDRWLKERLDTLVPMLMRRDKVAMWIMVAGEYNEDPVAETMLPANWLSARRRTILVFFDPGAGKPVERLVLARYAVGDFKPMWNPDAQPDQWATLAKIVEDRDPSSIALNITPEFPLADGMTASYLRELTRALGPKYAGRFVSYDRLGLGWMETRIPAEMATYPTLSRISHAIIQEGFSERAITPGVTSTDDLVWWFRERIAALKLDTWFQPSVSIQRPKMGTFEIATMSQGNKEIIQPGDMLHVDFGISYLGLKTDVQRMAYVLRPGETEAPKGLRDGLAAMNVVQRAVTAELQAGRTGDQVLAAARKRFTAQGVKGSVYSHAIGYNGHGAGPWIGAWEDQSGVPFRGAYPIHPNTAWSIELNASHAVPEWGGQEARFMFEEDGFYDGTSFRFLDGFQTDMILIPRP